ncbi:pyrimidine dimer DNA glycosylase/endonuclease V [Georgenia sp. Marseille-Q6866]
MRVWSVHPRYLDRQGLVACWRETLLAQAVLAGRTKGYLNHSQLVRFRATADPLASVCAYLGVLAVEADERGYRFDRSRIDRAVALDAVAPLPVTEGQVAYEWAHLLAKLAVRSPDRYALVRDVTDVEVHPSSCGSRAPSSPGRRPEPASPPPPSPPPPQRSAGGKGSGGAEVWGSGDRCPRTATGVSGSAYPREEEREMGSDV